MSLPILVLILALTSWVQADENVCNNIENGEFLQHAFDDTKYIMCWDGEPTEKTCFRGIFNPTTKECSRISKNSFECPTETFFADFPVDYECSKFIRCLNGKASTHFCGKDLLFDPIRKQCNHKEFVVCPCPAIDKPDNPLFVRDWTDCAKYHVCFNGSVAISDRCSSNLYFDLDKKQCAQLKRHQNGYYDSNNNNCLDISTSF